MYSCSLTHRPLLLPPPILLSIPTPGRNYHCCINMMHLLCVSLVDFPFLHHCDGSDVLHYWLHRDPFFRLDNTLVRLFQKRHVVTILDVHQVGMVKRRWVH
jgi:hypothetical protein